VPFQAKLCGYTGEGAPAGSGLPQACSSSSRPDKDSTVSFKVQ
jgi:hypothetical protein